MTPPETPSPPWLSHLCIAVVAGFSLSAVGMEWLVEANHQRLLHLSPRLLSPGIWSAALVLVGGVAFVVLPRSASIRARVRGITVPVVCYALATALSVVIAVIRVGPSQLLLDIQSVALAIAPLGVAALLAVLKRPRAGLWLVSIVTTILCGYALIQWPRLHFGTTFDWFTLGSAGRWWDSRAVFGPFATTGNHAFADALVLLGAVLLPWATSGALPRAERIAIGGLYLILAAIVALTLARAALLSLAFAAIVLFPNRNSFRPALVLTFVVLALIAIPQTRTALTEVYQRGFFDESAQIRFRVWSALAEHPQAQWLIGDGANTVTTVTRDMGIDVPHPGDQRLGPTTDNLYLRRLIEAGGLGLGTFAALLITGIRESFRSKASPEGEVWNKALRALMVSLAIQSITSDTLVNPEIAAVFACCLGAIMAGLLVDLGAIRKLATKRTPGAIGPATPD